MKKLFAIFTLTLSTNAFSFGLMTCDQFLDFRAKDDDTLKGIIETMNNAAFMFYVSDIRKTVYPIELRQTLNKSILNQLSTPNQMLYL